MKQYTVDAFTDKLFKGNPAAVCISERPLDDKLMCNIAKENNLSETAFLVKNETYYDLRWFTPASEIDFCGHATLAYGNSIKTVKKLIKKFCPGMGKNEINDFIYALFPFIYGIYPYVAVDDKQKQAMEAADTGFIYHSVYELAYNAIRKLLG